MLLKDKIPAGLIDDSTEFFFLNSTLFVLYSGRTWEFDELPKQKVDQLYDLMIEDDQAMKLLKAFGPQNRQDQVYLYYKCRCGGLDSVGDISDTTINTENWQCGDNCQCILRPRFRAGVAVANGVLTKREMEVIRVICSEPFPTTYAAADHLNVQQKTLDNHKQSIFNKTGVHSMQELTSLSIKKGWL